MLRYLRIAVTALSLTACVLLILFWVRDYRDRWSWIDRMRAERRLLANQFYFVVEQPTPSGIIKVHLRNDAVALTLFGIPYWALVLSCAVIGSTPWIHWSKRFSLRTLLIATTLVAVGLGIVVMSS
jgi:hypothetical protein